MRFLITAASDPQAPASDRPLDDETFTAYMRFNEEMHRAGVLVASEGLNPGREGVRVGISKGKRTVLDGPFVESKELVGGFYLIEAKDLDQALEVGKLCPAEFGGVEVRPIMVFE